MTRERDVTDTMKLVFAAAFALLPAPVAAEVDAWGYSGPETAAACRTLWDELLADRANSWPSAPYAKVGLMGYAGSGNWSV